MTMTRTKNETRKRKKEEDIKISFNWIVQYIVKEQQTIIENDFTHFGVSIKCNEKLYHNKLTKKNQQTNNTKMITMKRHTR